VKKFWLLSRVVFIFSVLVLPINAKVASLDEFSVSENFNFQETPVWCWAASIEMCLDYYGFDVSQPEIVARTFGGAIPAAGNWIQITQNLNYVGQDAKGKNVLVSASVYWGSPSSEVIVNHLKNNNPIIMAFHNPSTFIGHAVVITGVEYSVINGRVKIHNVTVRDPFPYSPAHVANGGRVTYPNNIQPTHIWLVSATVESD